MTFVITHECNDCGRGVSGGAGNNHPRATKPLGPPQRTGTSRKQPRLTHTPRSVIPLDMNWLSESARTLFALTSCALLAIAVGCVKPRRSPPIDLSGLNQWQPVEPHEPFGTRGTPLAISNSASGVIQAGHSDLKSADPQKPKTILALSGGGMYGSYTAGVLNGWTKSGQRPEFDVVT